ncbi:MAG: DNA ligase [Campylobacteraceae bacterium]
MRVFVVIFLLFINLYAQKSDLMLLETFKNENVSGWLMSEKLDGVRAYWDGGKLLSRNGNVFNAPAWFTQDFPNFPLDGELYSKELKLNEIYSIVSKKQPHDDWNKIKLFVFDAPTKSGGLVKRLDTLKDIKSTYIEVIEQFTCKDNAHLFSFLKEIEKRGGEGVVVREPSSSYIPKRNHLSLKVKSFYDDECTVAEIKEDEKNRVSSFTCKTKENITFKIGSGMDEILRTNNNLQIGTIITYKHLGVSGENIPKNPVFLRIKEEF